jgi:hypothetical protein
VDGIDIRYIAGFFDGEGSIGIYYRKKNKDRFHLRTQLTQNKSDYVEYLMNYLMKIYGGNLGEQITLSGHIKYNWQLNADKAVHFLREILPHLILKKAQADIAIKWQTQRPKVSRDKKGRICSKCKDTVDYDIKIAKIIELLKIFDINEVMSNQNDLVKVLVELHPLAVVKG